MIFRPYLLFVVILSAFSSFAQNPPVIVWQKALGGSAPEWAYSVDQTNDGGYAVAGWTGSSDGDVAGNHGGGDVWVAKLDSLGNLQWQKALGGSSAEEASSIEQTSDGGYVVAGMTTSNDGDVSGNHGGKDIWVVKLDSLGTLLWQNALGGSGDDRAYSVDLTNDGGYIVAGYSGSNDGDVSGNHGFLDSWVVKLDSLGTMTWQKALGGSTHDRLQSIQETSDGGYVGVGLTTSNDGDVSGNHGGSDVWVVKLDGLGNLQWQKALGGSTSDYGSSIEQTVDGGYIVAGSTDSNDGDVSGIHGGDDMWVVKLDSSGNLLWQKALGGSNGESAQSVEQASDGGYVVAGFVWSNDGDVSGNHGSGDFWVVKLDSLGTMTWQKTLGGSSQDHLHSMQEISDGGFIVAGFVLSNDGDVSGNHGSTDFWVVKLSPSATTGVDDLFGTAQSDGSDLSIYPNPTSGEFQLSLESDFIETVSITDVAGREVLRKNMNASTVVIDLADHPTGAYMLRVRTTSGLDLQKVLVKR